METKWLFRCSAALLALAAPALAVDGVREINQTCAETSGCFVGDTAGFPVTITQIGSYRLTGNLQRPDPNTDGIVISQSDVSLDLNGFRIAGGTNCDGTPVSCTSPGSGRGVTVTSDFVSEVVVRNGSVRGAGDLGVYVGRNSRVEDVLVASSGGDAIRAADFSQVRRCGTNETGGRGIRVMGHTIVEGNVVHATGATMSGIEVAGIGALIRDNKVHGAHGDGIKGADSALVTGNDVSGSGDDAIEVVSGSRIVGNVISYSTASGIHFTSGDSSYADNVLSLNGSAVTAPATNVNLGGNLCNGVICP